MATCLNVIISNSVAVSRGKKTKQHRPKAIGADNLTSDAGFGGPFTVPEQELACSPHTWSAS